MCLALGRLWARREVGGWVGGWVLYLCRGHGLLCLLGGVCAVEGRVGGLDETLAGKTRGGFGWAPARRQEGPRCGRGRGCAVCLWAWWWWWPWHCQRKRRGGGLGDAPFFSDDSNALAAHVFLHAPNPTHPPQPHNPPTRRSTHVRQASHAKPSKASAPIPSKLFMHGRRMSTSTSGAGSSAAAAAGGGGGGGGSGSGPATNQSFGDWYAQYSAQQQGGVGGQDEGTSVCVSCLSRELELPWSASLSPPNHPPTHPLPPSQTQT